MKSLKANQVTTAINSINAKTDSTFITELLFNLSYQSLVNRNLNVKAITSLLDNTNACGLKTNYDGITVKAFITRFTGLVQDKETGKLSRNKDKAQKALSKITKAEELDFDTFALALNNLLSTPKKERAYKYTKPSFKARNESLQNADADNLADEIKALKAQLAMVESMLSSKLGGGLKVA